MHVHDPLADAAETLHEYGVTLTAWDDLPRAEAIVAAVAHRAFTQRPVDELVGKVVSGGIYMDVKARANMATLRARGLQVWRL